MDLKKFISDFESSLTDLGSEPITGDTIFRDLKYWDSMSILVLTSTIDLEYGVLLQKEDILSTQTISELFNLVQSKL